MKHVTQKERLVRGRNEGIVALYTSGRFTTAQIAKDYNLRPRSIQRIVAQAGKIRTAAQSNKLVAPLKNYSRHRIPVELRAKRKHLTLKLRYKILSEASGCVVCGSKEQLEVDHKDNSATNNELSNLQVLCMRCNPGKSHLDRYGS